MKRKIKLNGERRYDLISTSLSQSLSRCNHEILIGSGLIRNGTTQPVKRSWRRARAERTYSLLDRPQPAQR